MISAGSIDELSSFAEKEGDEWNTDCGNDCELTKEDVDKFVREFSELVAGRDKSRVMKVDVYLPTSLFEESNREVLEYFFAECKKLTDAGVAEWASQKEVYETARDWLK